MLDDRPYMRSPYRPAWPVSVIIIVINTAVFAAQLITSIAYHGGNNPFDAYLSLRPSQLLHGWVWQLGTFQFLHNYPNPLHLILNCWMLYMFGRVVEDALGKRRFLEIYFGSGVVGGLLHCALSWIFPSFFHDIAVVGASAGVFGLMAAFAVMNWEQPITTLIAFILPVTMRAKYLILVMAIIAMLGIMDRSSGIAHAAHLGGLLAGLVYVKYLVSNHSFFSFDRFRRLSPRRELVQIPASQQALWQRAKKTSNEELPSEEFISKEVDPILDKISAHGIQSLTERERKILEAARAKMARK